MMELKDLFVAFVQYRYLKETAGYNEEYQARLEAALDLVQDAMVSDLIDDDIDASGDK